MDAVIGASDVLTRLLWAAAIAAAGLLLYRAVNSALLARARRNAEPLQDVETNRRGEEQPGLPDLLPGGPAILYFTTPECAPCRTIQRPALQVVQQRLGGRLRVIEINAQERPDLASRWGVLSVPTTFILDRQGSPQVVNHGAARAEKLLQQLEKVL